MCLSIVVAALVAIAAEIASLTLLDQLVGPWTTFGVVLATVALGAVLLAGRAALTLRRAAAAFAHREPVAPVVVGSALVGAAGVLLCIPGLLSDALGLALLIPPVRARAARGVIERFQARVIGAAPPPWGDGAGRGPGGATVIDTTAVETRDPGPSEGAGGAEGADRALPGESPGNGGVS